MKITGLIVAARIIAAYSASKISVWGDDRPLQIAAADIVDKCFGSSERWSELLIIAEYASDEIIGEIYHKSKTSNLIVSLDTIERKQFKPHGKYGNDLNGLVQWQNSKMTAVMMTVYNLKQLDSVLSLLKNSTNGIWRPESYFFVVVERGCDTAECSNMFKVIWNYWILNAVILCSSNDPANRNRSGIELYTFNPYSGDHSRQWETIIRETVEVSISTGKFNHSWYIFKQIFNGIESFEDCGDIFFDKTSNLDGYVIPTSFDHPEFLLNTTLDPVAKILVKDSHTLKTISKKLRFNVSQVVSHDMDGNDSYSGMMGDIQKGRSHLGPIFRGMRIYPGLEMTYPHDDVSACFASRIRGTRPQWTNLAFDRHIWIGLGLGVLFFTVVLYLQNKSHGIVAAFLEALRLIIGSSIIHTSTVFKYRIILASIFLVILVFDGAVKGRFISILTIVRPYPNLDTIEQLRERDIDLYGHEAFKYFIKDPGLVARLKTNLDMPECLATLERVNRQQICFQDCSSLELLTLNSTNIHVSSTPFFTGYVTYSATMHWPMTDRYSLEVIKLVESGIFKKWALNMKREIEVDGWKAKRAAEPANIKPAKLNDLLPAFVLLFAGLSIALIAFVCEMISYEYLRRVES